MRNLRESFFITNRFMTPNDTICALATATGGAIVIIRLSGPKAIDITNRIFNKNLNEAQPNTIHFGRITDEEGEVVDEPLVSVFRAPHSYTGEDSTEISLHGSPYIAQRVLRLLLKHGARQALPGEFTQRAFINGKMDLSQAEAVADLIAASNQATHRIAISQMRGRYSQRLKELRAKLLNLTTLLELELDFSEEDVEFADRDELIQLTDVIDHEVTRLAESFRQGNAIKNGVPVAIIGAPNVGKSTLLNALLRDDRAIVSDIQGTTRDLIEDTITLRGIQFRFIDTAGIRHTQDTIEQIGIERSLKAAQKAQIIILLTEPGIPYPDIPIQEGQILIRRENKTASFQALTGQGLQQLENELLAAVSPSDEDILVSNIRHYEALREAQRHLCEVKQALEQKLPGDLVSPSLHAVLDDISNITGEGRITSQETLNNLFGHFCIGK